MISDVAIDQLALADIGLVVGVNLFAEHMSCEKCVLVCTTSSSPISETPTTKFRQSTMQIIVRWGGTAEAKSFSEKIVTVLETIKGAYTVVDDASYQVLGVNFLSYPTLINHDKFHDFSFNIKIHYFIHSIV